MAGGNNAFKMLAFAEVDPRNKKHRMGWLSHYNEWLETLNGVEDNPTTKDNEQQKRTHDRPPEPDLYSSLMVGDPGQICEGFQSMQKKTMGLYLQAKDTGERSLVPLPMSDSKICLSLLCLIVLSALQKTWIQMAVVFLDGSWTR